MTDLFQPESFTWADAGMRLIAATILPFAIGLERYLHDMPIDFRPFIIISIAPCGLIIGSIELLGTYNEPNVRIDPTRVIAGVITGIGFIGAGAMFRNGPFVQGAGSAVAIWGAGAIGLLCGMGEVWLAAIVAGTVVLLLIASRPFTEKWDPDHEGDGASKAEG